tara:strand:- start:137 stop:358 length:222 start_codon:yes stop_codon:yes gene_type:complete
MFEQLLNEVIPEYTNRINFYRTNIEQEPKLSEIFEVRGIPYFIMISKDGGISPGGGALNKETLRYFLEGLLLK